MVRQLEAPQRVLTRMLLQTQLAGQTQLPLAEQQQPAEPTPGELPALMPAEPQGLGPMLAAARMPARMHAVLATPMLAEIPELAEPMRAVGPAAQPTRTQPASLTPHPAE